jgi:hypothetical protein
MSLSEWMLLIVESVVASAFLTAGFVYVYVAVALQ